MIGNATSNVVISAGKTLATLIVGAENTVSAQVLRTEILAGYFHDTTSNVRGDAGNADADITTVRINGDFFASSIVAGVQAGADGYFGTADDASIVGGTDVRANQSKISSVVIRGLVAGTGSINDHFGIVAESVGSVRVGGALVAGLNSRLNIIDLISATTGDLTVREVI